MSTTDGAAAKADDDLKKQDLRAPLVQRAVRPERRADEASSTAEVFIVCLAAAWRRGAKRGRVEVLLMSPYDFPNKFLSTLLVLIF